VKGYFYWSAMDSLEWTAGFRNRYGIVYVDFKTQQRTPKRARHCSAKRQGSTRWCNRTSK